MELCFVFFHSTFHHTTQAGGFQRHWTVALLTRDAGRTPTLSMTALGSYNYAQLLQIQDWGQIKVMQEGKQTKSS